MRADHRCSTHSATLGPLFECRGITLTIRELSRFHECHARPLRPEDGLTSLAFNALHRSLKLHPQARKFSEAFHQDIHNFLIAFSHLEHSSCFAYKLKTDAHTPNKVDC